MQSVSMDFMCAPLFEASAQHRHHQAFCIEKNMVVVMTGGHPMPQSGVQSSPVPLDTSGSTVLEGPLFHSVPIAGKGMGCVASRSIVTGERLVAERALFMQEKGPCTYRTASQAVAMLSSADRAVFFSLSQNEARWGPAKHIDGLFATNAIPSHSYNTNVSAIFPNIARLNHACAPNAVFKWNSGLDAETVHAIRPIAAGEEVVVSYGLPPGVLLHDERQRYYAQAFGFQCRCSKCMLSGAARAESDRRLAEIGHPVTILDELRELGSLRRIVLAAPQEALHRFERKYELMRLEGEGPSQHAFGVEAYLHYFCEFCDSAVTRLRALLRKYNAGAVVGGGGGTGAATHITLSLSSPESGDGVEKVRVSVYALEDKVATYAHAAKQWAMRALPAARDVHGEDSPTFACWAASMASGCWDAEGAGTFDFARRFMDACLSKPQEPLDIGENPRTVTMTLY